MASPNRGINTQKRHKQLPALLWAGGLPCGIQLSGNRRIRLTQAQYAIVRHSPMLNLAERLA